MLAILLFLIFIRPFICSVAFPFVNFLYSLLLIAFLSLWIIIKKPSLKPIKEISYPLILFILALFISVIFSPDRTISINESYKYISGVLFFLVSMSLSYKERGRILLSIVGAGLLISFLAIYQYFFVFQHLLNYLSKQKISNEFVLDYITRGRAFFPFVTPNTLGGYLAMIIPLTLTYKNRFWLIPLLSFALLLTKSVGAILSIFLASAIYFYLQGKLEKKKILFLSGLVAVLGLIFIARTAFQKQHLQPIFSAITRFNYWQDTLRIIRASPFIGVGPGNFDLMKSRYAHNSYLQIWAEMGIFGLGSLLWLIVLILRKGLANIRDSAYKNKILALTAANAVFLLHNFVDFSFFLPEVSLIWWVILGLLFSYTNEWSPPGL
jgi:O-antigen ligase